jgi:hypothetical protein
MNLQNDCSLLSTYTEQQLHHCSDTAISFTSINTTLCQRSLELLKKFYQ